MVYVHLRAHLLDGHCRWRPTPAKKVGECLGSQMCMQAVWCLL